MGDTYETTRERLIRLVAEDLYHRSASCDEAVSDKMVKAAELVDGFASHRVEVKEGAIGGKVEAAVAACVTTAIGYGLDEACRELRREMRGIVHLAEQRLALVSR